MNTASSLPGTTMPDGPLAMAANVLDLISKVRARYGVHDRPDIISEHVVHPLEYHDLNDETLQAFADVDSGRGVEHARTIAEMVKKLDL